MDMRSAPYCGDQCVRLRTSAHQVGTLKEETLLPTQYQGCTSLYFRVSATGTSSRTKLVLLSLVEALAADEVSTSRRAHVLLLNPILPLRGYRIHPVQIVRQPCVRNTKICLSATTKKSRSPTGVGIVRGRQGMDSSDRANYVLTAASRVRIQERTAFVFSLSSTSFVFSSFFPNQHFLLCSFLFVTSPFDLDVSFRVLTYFLVDSDLFCLLLPFPPFILRRSSLFYQYLWCSLPFLFQIFSLFVSSFAPPSPCLFLPIFAFIFRLIKISFCPPLLLIVTLMYFRQKYEVQIKLLR